MAAIEVTVPSDPQFMRLVRLLASGVGSLAGFDIEDIEDFRIGVDEACTVALSACGGQGLKLSFDLDDEGVAVKGATIGPIAGESSAVFSPVQQSLSDRILGVVVDRHEIKVEKDSARFELHKRRAS